MIKKLTYLIYWMVQPAEKIRIFYKLATKSSSFLVRSGWIRAYMEKKPLDQDGNPLPWNTYGYIDFIKERLPAESHVFEYGAGFSTMFYQNRVAKVTSVEHDKVWYELLKPQLKDNVDFEFQELVYGGEYCQATLKKGEKYDLIVVDGRDRVACMRHAPKALSENGVIVLDDSFRERYQEGIDYLLAQGFKHLHFAGLKPGSRDMHRTTIFYKEKNIFQL